MFTALVFPHRLHVCVEQAEYSTSEPVARVAPEAYAPSAAPPDRQIHLRGAIEFAAHKEGKRSRDVAFARAAEAIAICEHVAETYAAAIAGARDPPRLYVEGHTSSEPKGHADSVRVSLARAALCARHIRRKLRALRPGWHNWLRGRRLVVAVGYGAARPLPGYSDGKNHKENRRVEVHMRRSAQARSVGRIQLKPSGAAAASATTSKAPNSKQAPARQ